MTKEELYEEFINLYPISRLENLTLEEYTNLNKDSFCYWIENKLNDWGNIHGATSYKFGIFQWGKKPELEKTSVLADEKYAWQDRFGKTSSEAFQNIKAKIIEIAKYAARSDYSKIDTIDISEMFKWKIAFLYSNKKLINWFSREALITFVNYFEKKADNKTPTSELQKLLLEEKGERSLDDFNKILLPIWHSHQEKEDWLPKGYNPDISTEQWIELINDKNIFTDNSLITFACLQKAKIPTCTDMAIEFGRTKNFYNNNIWRTGERIYNKIKCPLDERETGENRYWSICCLGRNLKNGLFEYQIRQELQDAFEETGILNDIECFDSKENLMNTNKKIWKVSHGTVDFTEENITEYLNDSYVCVHKDTKSKGVSSIPQGKAFTENVTPGDLFYLCRGNQRFLLIGEFTSDPVEIDEDGWAWRKYKKLYSPIKDGNYDGPSKWWTPNNNSTFIEIKENEYSDFESLILKPYFGIDLQKLGFIDGEKNMEKINEYRNLLLENHNLILHGAPGTGKTHLAKEIAAQMICEKSFEEIEKGSDEEKSFNEQTEFVQFHPSYDYSDFVEGLRPVEGDNGQVGFERKDGVFKEFCERALKTENSGGTDNFEDAWKLLVNDLEEKDFIDVPMLSNRGTFRVELNEYGTGLANRTYENDEYKKDAWINGKSKFFNKDQLYNIYRGLPGCPAGGHDNYRRAIVNYMKQNYGLEDYSEGNIDVSTKQKPYIFIIDEINRGELSKIFGELFFSIDPGYRGTKGKVRTQYANMVKGKNEFDIRLNSSTFGNFFIPDNVYIIGTMNDIDRSVESMDFAMRRRFVFKEVTAEDSAKNMNLPQAAIERMTRINDVIHETEGLGDAYKIGGAYFLGVDDFDLLWKIKLSSLIKEYLRGIDDDGTKFTKIEEAYFGKLIDSSSNEDTESTSSNGNV